MFDTVLHARTIIFLLFSFCGAGMRAITELVYEPWHEYFWNIHNSAYSLSRVLRPLYIDHPFSRLISLSLCAGNASARSILNRRTENVRASLGVAYARESVPYTFQQRWNISARIYAVHSPRSNRPRCIARRILHGGVPSKFYRSRLISTLTLPSADRGLSWKIAWYFYIGKSLILRCTNYPGSSRRIDIGEGDLSVA